MSDRFPTSRARRSWLIPEFPRARRWMRFRTVLPIAFLTLALNGCDRPANQLQNIKHDGYLLVATRNSPTTYYEGVDGPTGLEYDLVARFAERLGVELRLITSSNVGDILSMVTREDVHFAAAGITDTEARREFVRFTEPYQQIREQVVYRSGSKKPRKLEELDQYHLEVVAGSSHVERLKTLSIAYRDLHWSENDELDSDELLYLVWEQVIDVTIADSNELAMARRFYPELRVAFDLAPPQPLAWAFPMHEDRSLYRAAQDFLREMRESGELDVLIDKHYGHVERFDYVGTTTYRRHILERLPEYQKFFQRAAAKHGLDWRLLAAMGYQESHWNPRAVSPTGVRGIMMLTRDTAKRLKIKNRRDPKQSIEGGARYIAELLTRIPERIPEPDRTWLAIAAYNVGLGHLEDARVITESRGGNPDLWKDVRENLPLLARKKWYRKTKHGYARGREPVRYVENIRSYYDLLVWQSSQDTAPVPEPKGLDIDSPVL